MTNKEITITKIYDIGKPVEVVAMAKLLKNIVVSQKLYSNIKGKNYCQVEGWQLAGFMTGMNVIVEEPKDLSNDKEIKYSVTAKIYQGEKVVGVGYAICSSKEATKKGFDEYAILSMAQTRAIGKAYRNKIGWVMKLAGYEATPSEEMHKVDETPKSAEPVVAKEAGPIEDYVCVGAMKGGCGNDITKQEAEYSKKLYGKHLCRVCQKLAKK